MATLLANPKMNPALAARVEASVTGHRGRRTASQATARWTSWTRLGVLTALVWLAISIVLSVRRERVELARSRASLFARWQAQAAPLTLKEKSFLERAEQVLAALRTTSSSDVIPDELRTEGGLEKTLTRPAVYLRGPAAMLDGTAGAIGRAAADSGKDTLLLCLMDPPSSRDEKALLTKARFAMAGGAPFLQRTENVLRLHDVEIGLPVLLDPWGERIRAAKDAQELQRVEREFKRAPIAAAKRAARAELLVSVVDEPSDKGSVTELDGEAPHTIRLAIIEIASGRMLLRVHRHVDPSWISSHRRSQYARELDGCRFALSVHDAVRGTLGH